MIERYKGQPLDKSVQDKLDNLGRLNTDFGTRYEQRVREFLSLTPTLRAELLGL